MCRKTNQNDAVIYGKWPQGDWNICRGTKKIVQLCSDTDYIEIEKCWEGKIIHHVCPDDHHMVIEKCVELPRKLISYIQTIEIYD